MFGSRYFEVNGDNWKKAELLTKAAYSGLHNADISLLHAAAGTYCPLGYLKMVAKTYPFQLSERDRYGRVPLAVAVTIHTDIFSFHPKLLNMVLMSSVDTAGQRDYDRQTDADGRTARTFSSSIKLLLSLCPLAARMADIDGRSPLFLALESGKEWGEGIECLIQAAPEALKSRDTKYHLYPFMLAAVGSRSSVDTVFQLLLTCPEVAVVHNHQNL